jgi:hypothetical protein
MFDQDRRLLDLRLWTLGGDASGSRFNLSLIWEHSYEVCQSDNHDAMKLFEFEKVPITRYN